MSKHLYLSRSFAYTAGKPIKFNPWVPPNGPTGRRNMILGLLLKVSYSIDVGTAVIQGEDLARMFFNIKISTVGGDRWNLPGEASRMMSMILMGPQRFHESADVAVATPSTGDYALYIPLAKPYAHRWYDFAVPADVLREVEITCPSQSDLDLGTSTTTINAATMYSILAVTREVDAVEFPMFDVVAESAMETLTQGTIHVGGGYLAEAFAYASGTPGGAAMTNWTEHRIPQILPDSLQDDDWKFLYNLRNQAAPNDDGTPGTELWNDPVRQNRARIVHLLPGFGDDKLVDHPFVGGSLTVKATNSVADVRIAHRIIYPTPEAEVRKVGRERKVRTLRVKTKGKTRRGVKAWGPLAAFMPMSGER
jgi:hypothetical protein